VGLWLQRWMMMVTGTGMTQAMTLIQTRMNLVCYKISQMMTWVSRM